MGERIEAACGATVPLLAANFLLRSTGAATGVVVALYLARINAQVRSVGALEVSLIVVVSYTVVELCHLRHLHSNRTCCHCIRLAG